MLPLNWLVYTDQRSINTSVAMLVRLLHMQILPRLFNAIFLPAKSIDFGASEAHFRRKYHVTHDCRILPP